MKKKNVIRLLVFLLLISLVVLFKYNSLQTMIMAGKVKDDISDFSSLVSMLSKDSTVKKGFVFEDSLKNRNTADIIDKLKSKHYLNDIFSRQQSSIYYSGNYCMSFLIKKVQLGWVKYYHILMYNGNEGEMVCGINDLFTVNQDDEVASIDVQIKSIDALFNYVVVTVR